MDERLRFVAECLSGEETMTQLCAAFEISRKTGYKWLGRYRAFGPEGLHDQPRAPLEHGRATAAELVERIVAQKEAHPLWGPKKIMARLKRAEPSCSWPAVSTAGEILKRHGLVGRRVGARAGERRATVHGRSLRRRTRCGREITRAGSGPATAGAASR
ncbi:helix-turn-helix domain-containing protein [Mesorhizobium sp. B1-1-8]|nr:helix-turn-helix domain-containing protein [Mesorhizobium sp. B1-1-8]UCI06747.1 helix-turn-helix domain-containing protein [Mesorhizobium sp. B1-1-8]